MIEQLSVDIDKDSSEKKGSILKGHIIAGSVMFLFWLIVFILSKKNGWKIVSALFGTIGIGNIIYGIYQYNKQKQ